MRDESSQKEAEKLLGNVVQLTQVGDSTLVDDRIHRFADARNGADDGIVAKKDALRRLELNGENGETESYWRRSARLHSSMLTVWGSIKGNMFWNVFVTNSIGLSLEGKLFRISTGGWKKGDVVSTPFLCSFRMSCTSVYSLIYQQEIKRTETLK